MAVSAPWGFVRWDSLLGCFSVFLFSASGVKKCAGCGAGVDAAVASIAVARCGLWSWRNMDGQKTLTASRAEAMRS